ncbi:MAG: fibronectin type III domain-containing protein [Chitinispirillaceae bacterium]|nr:fibronectin type III domain-containing protein [Chitinispirillaceae bacterium]
MNTKRTLAAGCAASLLLCLSCADYDLLDDPDREPDPVSLEIIAVSDSSVTLRWTRCDDDDFRQYAVYYGTSDIVDRSDKLADSLSFDVDTVKTVRPLDDMTRYYFRVIVYNEGENFSVSNIVDTVTPENMKGKLKLAVPELTEDRAVRLRWTSALEEFNRYVIHADTTRTVDTTDTLLATVYSDTAETVEGLQPDRTWWLRVYARHDTAIVATSNTVEIRLPQ